MSLNIKNEETCRLAADLAQLTGQTKTGAVTQALRERMLRETRRRDAKARLERMNKAAQRCTEIIGPGLSSLDHGDILHDERGLPK